MTKIDVRYLDAIRVSDGFTNVVKPDHFCYPADPSRIKSAVPTPRLADHGDIMLQTNEIQDVIGSRDTMTQNNFAVMHDRSQYAEAEEILF